LNAIIDWPGTCSKLGNIRHSTFHSWYWRCICSTCQLRLNCRTNSWS
jgi:hypothetical protein